VIVESGQTSGAGAAPPDRGVVVVRHGATEWSETGQHTSRTDLPLLPEGRERAKRLATVLDPSAFARVLCSPLLRARETCELAGFGDRAEIVEDLREWDYGDYEGLTTPQIRERDPNWSLWRDGCPGGEAPETVAGRADRALARAGDGATIAFAHGHILRVCGARWIELSAAGGARLVLSPAALGVLGYERETRVLQAWNVDHL
jgi:broad specificity phosphatase PhoE